MSTAYWCEAESRPVMRKIPPVYELYEIVHTRGNTGGPKVSLAFVDQYPSEKSACVAAWRGLPKGAKYVVFEKRCIATNIVDTK